MRVPIFSGKGGIWGHSLGKISGESPEKGVCFVIASRNQPGGGGGAGGHLPHDWLHTRVQKASKGCVFQPYGAVDVQVP